MENSNNNASMEVNEYTIKAPRLCKMTRDPQSGYGFNLHGEKGVIGQYISAVDQGGPADISGLCVGDRVVEVNGINVESFNHAQVVSAIKSNPASTELLVIDKVTDNYLKSIGKMCTADLAEYKSVYDLENQSETASLGTPEKNRQDKIDEVTLDNKIEEEEQSPVINNVHKQPDDMVPSSPDSIKPQEPVDDTSSNISSEDKNHLDKDAMNDTDKRKSRNSQHEMSVPKRKQVKESKTDWRAKADLFNNL